jgi:hypothetical protein
MSASRDEASLVGITLRVRERLRRDLEETAKERGVSLNQQITDCLEHSRDRRELLPEVLTTAFTDKTAGIVLMLARVMEDVGFLHLRPRWRAYDGGIHWIEDPQACSEALNAAIAVLDAFPSRGTAAARRTRLGGASFRAAYEMVRAVSRPQKSASLSPRIVREVRALLGPLARRLTRPAAASASSPLSAQAVETASITLAAAIVEQINSSPRTPAREELAQLISSHLAKIGA